MGTPPPAGWYNDPAGSDGKRWWDGERWTDAVQTPESVTVADAPDPSPDPTATRKNTRRRTILIAAACVLAAGVSAAVIIPRLSGGDVPAADKIAASGTITAPAYTGYGVLAKDGRRCTTTSGYSDVERGMQVVLTSGGATLGISSLSEGIFVDAEGYAPRCIFTFEFPAVEVPGTFVELDMGRRGSLTFEKAELSSSLDVAIG